MSDDRGEIREPLSDGDEYEAYDYVVPARAPKPWWLRRLFVVPVMVFGIAALLIAIGFSRLGPIVLSKLGPQIETPPPPKQPDRMIELPAEPTAPTAPFKSLILDAAQSYLATGTLPAATMPPATNQKAR
jgi:hypothetical protein